MKNRIQSLSFIATLAVVFGLISWGSALAQNTSSTPDQTTPQTQPAPTPDTPPSQQTPQTQPTPTPDTPPATQQTPTSQTPSQTPEQSQTPNSQTPNSQTPPASDSGAAATSTEGQSFSGTVVKQGDKYMLKDDSGKTYDIDHQTDVAKFEGKRVRVKGTLDSTGSKIMVK